MKTLRWLAFSLSLLYALSAFFALTIGKSLSYEFRSRELAFEYYDNMPWMLSVAILVTMGVTVSSKYSSGRNTVVLVVTVLLAVYGGFKASQGQAGKNRWVTMLAWQNRADAGQKVVSQYLGNPGNMRLVKLTPVFLIFNKVEPVGAPPIGNPGWMLIMPQTITQHVQLSQ